jgi:peptide/nickel transport system substrate-binding protein
VPEFEELMARSVVDTDAHKLTELGKQIDRLVYDEALSVFLCCPMALVAVNRYVKFTGSGVQQPAIRQRYETPTSM